MFAFEIVAVPELRLVLTIVPALAVVRTAFTLVNDVVVKLVGE
jgi:hypothetical protein